MAASRLSHSVRRDNGHYFSLGQFILWHEEKDSLSSFCLQCLIFHHTAPALPPLCQECIRCWKGNERLNQCVERLEKGDWIIGSLQSLSERLCCFSLWLICIYVPMPYYMEGIRNRISDISADMSGEIISCNCLCWNLNSNILPFKGIVYIFICTPRLRTLFCNDWYCNEMHFKEPNS